MLFAKIFKNSVCFAKSFERIIVISTDTGNRQHPSPKRSWISFLIESHSRAEEPYPRPYNFPTFGETDSMTTSFQFDQMRSVQFLPVLIYNRRAAHLSIESICQPHLPAQTQHIKR